MLSVDNFEEQLQEEYGKIFDNISHFRARKRKHRVHTRGNGECGENLCLTTSYKIDEDKAELQGDDSVQTTDRATAEQDNDRTLKTLQSQKEHHQNGVNPPENEYENCSLYEKVAMDLETVFNKYMMVNQDPGSEKSVKGENNDEASLDVQKITDITEREKAMLRNEITYKTVRTKNDTLYIWTAMCRRNSLEDENVRFSVKFISNDIVTRITAKIQRESCELFIKILT